jgi:hypothetical protein
METAFERGSISELWKSNIEVEKWFDPAFHKFIDEEFIPASFLTVASFPLNLSFKEFSYLSL